MYSKKYNIFFTLRKHSSEITCQLLDSDLKRYERLVHRSCQVASENHGGVPPDHLYSSDCKELLDKHYPDGSYKTLKNTTWKSSLVAQEQIQKYDLACRRPFFGCTEKELLESEKKIISGSNDTARILNPSIESVSVNQIRPESPKNVFSIFKLKPTNLTTKRDEPKTSEDDPIPCGSIGKPNNKWSAYQNDTPDVIAREEVSNSQLADISFPVKNLLKRRKENVDEIINNISPAQQPSSFHTGTEVLQKQLALRNGYRSNNPTTSDSGQGSSTLVVAPVKKSLGGRRNVQSKFVPPFLQDSTPQQYE